MHTSLNHDVSSYLKIYEKQERKEARDNYGLFSERIENDIEICYIKLSSHKISSDLEEHLSLSCFSVLFDASVSNSLITTAMKFHEH